MRFFSCPFIALYFLNHFLYFVTTNVEKSIIECRIENAAAVKCTAECVLIRNWTIFRSYCHDASLFVDSFFAYALLFTSWLKLVFSEMNTTIFSGAMNWMDNYGFFIMLKKFQSQIVKALGSVIIIHVAIKSSFQTNILEKKPYNARYWSKCWLLWIFANFDANIRLMDRWKLLKRH